MRQEFMSMSLLKRQEFCSSPRTVFAWKCMSPNMLISELISPTYLTFILSEYYKNIEMDYLLPSLVGTCELSMIYL